MRDVWRGPRYRLRRVWVHAIAGSWQRARRGFSEPDWWSFDTYVCGVIARACADFRDHGHGRPINFSEDSWRDALTRIAEPLADYSEHKFDFDSYETELQHLAAAQEALRLFAENLGSMWD